MQKNNCVNTDFPPLLTSKYIYTSYHILNDDLMTNQMNDFKIMIIYDQKEEMMILMHMEMIWESKIHMDKIGEWQWQQIIRG